MEPNPGGLIRGLEKSVYSEDLRRAGVLGMLSRNRYPESTTESRLVFGVAVFEGLVLETSERLSSDTIMSVLALGGGL